MTAVHAGHDGRRGASSHRELTLPLARWARRAEVIRIGIEPAAQ